MKDNKKSNNQSAKPTKKRKTTYGLKISENHNISRPTKNTISLTVVTMNGMPVPNQINETIDLDIQDPTLKRMIRFYTINKDFMDAHELKLATTIIEYNDKYDSVVAILFPTNEVLVRDDISDLYNHLNRATRHDMDYQMRLRRQLIAKIAKLRKQRKK